MSLEALLKSSNKKTIHQMNGNGQAYYGTKYE